MPHSLHQAQQPDPHFFPSHPPPRLHLCPRGTTDPKSNRLLAGLTEPELQRWLPDLEAVDMPVGMVLRDSGRPQSHVYFPTTSIAAVMYGLADGRTGAVSLIGNEGIVGVSVFTGGSGALGSTVVLCAGRGFRMRAAALMTDFQMGAAVTQLMLRYTQALVTQLAQVVVCNRHHTIENRLCRLLLSTMDRLDGRADVVMTQELMASVLGVRREGVTEAAQKLQQSGLLRYQRAHITMLDRAGLERLSCECYAVVKKEYERLLPAVPHLWAASGCAGP